MRIPEILIYLKFREFSIKYQILTLFKATQYLKPHQESIGSALVNLITMLFGALFPAILGFAMDWNGNKVYLPCDYTLAVSIIPAAIGISLVGFVIFMFRNKAKN